MTARRRLATALGPLVLLAAACGGGGGLALGTEAAVEHAPGATGTPSKLGVTVEAVRKGSQAELKSGGFTLDGDELTATPYYVDVAVKNQGTAPVKPSVRISVEDSAENSVSPLTIIDLGGGKPFEPCKAADEKADLAAGATVKDCAIYLVPQSFEPETLAFLPIKPGQESEFVRWTFPAEG